MKHGVYSRAPENKIGFSDLLLVSCSLGNRYPLEYTSGHYSPISIPSNFMNKSKLIQLHVAKINYRKNGCKASRYTKSALGLRLHPYPAFYTITMKTGL